MRLTQAQIARVRDLEDSTGRISARRIVEDAKQASSPLHALFDWDRKSAAYAYWLHQAREVIGAVTVQVTRKEMTVETPCYVNLTGPARGYQRVDVLKADPAAARESLVYTLEVASGHLRRAYDLAGPLGLAREIDALLVQVAGVQRVAQSKAA
jgi:hypothetical protein